MEGCIFIKLESLKICPSSHHIALIIQRHPRAELI